MFLYYSSLGKFLGDNAEQNAQALKENSGYVCLLIHTLLIILPFFSINDLTDYIKSLQKSSFDSVMLLFPGSFSKGNNQR